MKDNKIASILNNEIMKNEIAEGDSWVQLAEDLSNIVEFGKKVNTTLTSDELLNLKKNIVASVRIETIDRKLERKDYGIVKDAVTFESNIQRIMTTDFANAFDSHMFDLSWANGKSWIDGRYYGTPLDSQLFNQVDTFKVVVSITDDEWRLALSDARELRRIIGLIETRVENTITEHLNALVKRLHVGLISACLGADNQRKIPLVTLFNARHNVGGTEYTISDIMKNRDLNALFNDFVKGLINKLVTYTSDPNKKYNDESVVTWCPRSDVNIVLLTDFANDIKYITDPVDYNIVEMPTYREITSWQTTGTDLVPDLFDLSTVKIDNGTESPTVYTNIVGVIYDTTGIGVTTMNGDRKITTEYVGSEGFTNYHSHVANRYYIDTRLSSVVLTLD